MAAPVYPALVTLRGPGPEGLPIDATTPLAVALAAGGAAVSDANPQPVKGVSFRKRFSFARVADTNVYGIGDVIGINAAGSPGSAIHTFDLIGPPGGHVIITDANFEIDLAAVPSGMAGFRLHLYDASPTAILDNAAWDLPANDRAAYLGYIDLGIPVDMGSTLYVQNPAVNKGVKLAAAVSSLFGILETRAGYTPASGTVYVIDLHAVAVG